MQILKANSRIAPSNNGTNANEQDETPLLIVSTRNHILKNRCDKRDSLVKKGHKRHVKVMKALSRFQDATYVSELRAIENQPTPQRAEELLKFVMDMEEND